MSRAFAALLLVATLGAQNQPGLFDKPPAGVEEALRDRISKFYQAHVDRKYRLADQYVAEESKDFFFAAHKPACLSFKIDRIIYSENYTKAKAVILCKQRVMMPGFPTAPMDVPMPDTWRVEKGEWFWYLDQSQGVPTPMGYSKANRDDGKSEGAAPPSPATIENMLKGVQAERNVVEFKASEAATTEVAISNSLPGSVTLKIDANKTPGLTAELDHAELKGGGQKSTLTLRFAPKPGQGRSSSTLMITVQPLGIVVPIRIDVLP
jgi:hypothetical protein